MDRTTLEQTLILIIADIAEVDADSIRPDMYLVGKELNLDSLALLRLLVRIDGDMPGRLKVADASELGTDTVADLTTRLLAD